MQPLLEGGEAGESLQPRDLLEEGPGLEGEQVVLAIADPGESMGMPPVR